MNDKQHEASYRSDIESVIEKVFAKNLPCDNVEGGRKKKSKNTCHNVDESACKTSYQSDIESMIKKVFAKRPIEINNGLLTASKVTSMQPTIGHLSEASIIL